MPTAAQFAKSMRRISRLIVSNVDAGFRATALAVDQAVVIGTPVDTGRARSNWRVSSGSPVSGAREAYSPGKGGSTSGPNTQGALAQGREAIQADRSGTIYISNNLPYIGELNDGTSAQAPAGFVQIAVQTGIAEVKKIKALSGA